MDLHGYVDRFREEVAAAAQLAGGDATATAERLLLALDPALRLVLTEVLSDAAAEISAESESQVTVDLRLRGRGLAFVVETVPTAPPAPPPAAPPAVDHPPTRDEAGEAEGGQVRITLRLPEALKVRAEGRAAERRQSLNTWLVDAVRTAVTRPGGWGADPAPGAEPGPGHGSPGPRRHVGWA